MALHHVKQDMSNRLRVMITVMIYPHLFPVVWRDALYILNIMIWARTEC